MSDVWLAACCLASEEARQLLGRADCNALTSAEAERLGRLQAPRRRRQFLVGHALLRALLRAPQVAARCGACHALSFPVDQAPRLDGGHSPLRLGLAHSGDWVFAVAASGRVGLDGECCRERPQWRELALATCPELFSGMQPMLTDFYRAWTLKEAWLKSQGAAATPGSLQALRIRPPVPADSHTLTSWTFAAGVVSCLACRDAVFHWPLGLPRDFGLQPSTVWAMDALPEAVDMF